MALTLALLREDLRNHLGVDSDDLNDVGADRLINRSWWPMAAQMGFHEKDKELTFNTVAGTDSYDLPVDSDQIERVVVKGPDDTSYSPLTRIDDWNMFPKADDTDQGYPTHYSRRNNQFILWPNPDEAFEVKVKYQKTLDDIQTTGPDVPQEWHEVVLWGAISRGFFIMGDWVRGNAAQAQQAIFLASLSTQKEREYEDKHLSGVTVLKRRYP